MDSNYPQDISRTVMLSYNRSQEPQKACCTAAVHLRRSFSFLWPPPLTLSANLSGVFTKKILPCTYPLAAYVSCRHVGQQLAGFIAALGQARLGRFACRGLCTWARGGCVSCKRSVRLLPLSLLRECFGSIGRVWTECTERAEWIMQVADAVGRPR
jgi:hypothetical protein